MTTEQIAKRLHELCSQNQYEQCYKELFHPEAKATEPPLAEVPGPREVQGIPAFMEKGKQFNDMIEEMHGGYVGEPKVFGNYIFMDMGLDATFKGQGRMKMDEMVKYTVVDGKIVQEEYFF